MNTYPMFYTSHPITQNAHSPILEKLVENATSMRKFFQEFMDSRRDLDGECGYPLSVDDPANFRDLFDRMPIARRVVELMPKECWQVQPLVFETEDPEEVTEFELAWDNLAKTLRGEASWYQNEAGSPVWEYLKRADIMSGIGRFGVILLGIDDGRPLHEPAEGVVSMTPPNGKKKKPTPAPSNPTVNASAFNAGRPASPENNPKKVAPLYNPCFNGDVELAKRALQLEEESVQTFVKNISSFDNTYGVGSSKAYSGVQGTDAQYDGVDVGGESEFPSEKTAKKKRNLLFLRTFDESLVQITQYEADLRNPRFGKPVMYRITLNDPREQPSGSGVSLATARVHWSRVIHIADNLQCSEVMGCPRMKPVLNNILDLRKIYGGSPEGYWKNACGGVQFKTHPSMGGDVNIDIERLRDTVENYQNSQQKFLLGVGGEWGTIQGNVIDPGPHIKVQIQAICICYGWPENIFMGTQTGVLAGDQDSEAFYLRRVPERQMNGITPNIIIPFVDRLIQLGVLPAPTKDRTGEEGEEEESVENANPEGHNQYTNHSISHLFKSDGKLDPEKMKHEKCYACGKKGLKKLHLATTGEEGNVVCVGPDCHKKIKAAGITGHQPQKGGPRLYPTANVEYQRDSDGYLPPGVYRRVRTRLTEVYNSDTGKVELKPKTTETTIIKTSGGYSIEWPDLDSISEKDKATIFGLRATAYGAYISSGMEAMIPPKVFMTEFDSMEDSQAEAILDMAKQAQEAEDVMTQAPMDGGRPIAPEEGQEGFQPEPEEVPRDPIKVKPGEKLVHPDSVQPK